MYVVSSSASYLIVKNICDSQVDTLSELFVAWDDAITGAEDAIVQLEREKGERRRLGLESE